MMIALWQHGLKPSVRCLQLIDKQCTTMKEAIERARRHEASGLAGGHVNALFKHVPYSALDHTPARPAPVQNRTNDKRSRGRGSSHKRSTGRSPSSNRVEQCTHSTCRSKQGHSIDQCWTCAREERLARETASGAAGASASDASSWSTGRKSDKKKRKPTSEGDGSD